MMAGNDYEKAMNQLIGMGETHAKNMTTNISNLETRLKELLGGLIRERDRERAARVRAQEVLEELWAKLSPDHCPLCDVYWKHKPPHTADCELVAARKEPE